MSHTRTWAENERTGIEAEWLPELHEGTVLTSQSWDFSHTGVLCTLPPVDCSVPPFLDLNSPLVRSLPGTPATASCLAWSSLALEPKCLTL